MHKIPAAFLNEANAMELLWKSRRHRSALLLQEAISTNLSLKMGVLSGKHISEENAFLHFWVLAFRI